MVCVTLTSKALELVSQGLHGRWNRDRHKQALQTRGGGWGVEAHPPVPLGNRLALQPETPSSPYPKSPGPASLTHHLSEIWTRPPREQNVPVVLKLWGTSESFRRDQPTRVHTHTHTDTHTTTPACASQPYQGAVTGKINEASVNVLVEGRLWDLFPLAQCARSRGRTFPMVQTWSRTHTAGSRARPAGFSAPQECWALGGRLPLQPIPASAPRTPTPVPRLRLPNPAPARGSSYQAAPSGRLFPL